MIKVLFVCMGNICRSPAAEGAFLHLLKEAKLENLVLVDSAGTTSYHSGEPADARMQAKAKERGVELLSLARAVVWEDFERFDWILTMDKRNLQQLQSLIFQKAPQNSEKYSAKIIPFVSLCSEHNLSEVPDPYYGGDDGFDLVMDIVEDGSRGLLSKVKSQLQGLGLLGSNT